VTTSPTLADRLFAAERAVTLVEDELHELLITILGGDGYEDVTHDHYDRSIEIYGVGPDVVLSADDQEKLRAAGFDRCWTHVHKTEARQPGERSYLPQERTSHMSADKRSVATDALATLGTIIGPGEKRDAIHLAVEPVEAGEGLAPGDHIAIKDGIATGVDVGTGLGIVDPFLTKRVKKGERFWFVMYPRMVHSLRHVWTHPAFPDEPGVSAVLAQAAPELNAKASAENALREMIAGLDCPSYETVLGRIIDGDFGDLGDEYFHFDGQDAHGELPPGFWELVEVVIGRKVGARPKYFSCSC
jgi:hypothetical protein